jgi:hypothetical protein
MAITATINGGNANFFHEANSKWALIDNFGNVAQMPA